MKLTEISIKSHMAALAFYLLIIIGGYVSYQSMEKAEDPGFSIKTAVITTHWPGATAEQMEKLVSDRITEVLQSMEEMDKVQTKNRDGVSEVFFDAEAHYWGDELLPIWDKLRKKVETDVVPKMPEGVIGPIVNDEFGDIFGTLIAVSGDGHSYTQLYNEAEKLRETLLVRIPQIGKIDMWGEQGERIYVEYNNARLAESNIALGDIVAALTSRNIIIPGGEILGAPNRMPVLPTGNFQSIEEVGDTVINVPGSNEVVYLRDIATVTRGYVDPVSYIAQFNGEKSVVLGISLKSGEDDILLGRGVKEVLETEQLKAPHGINYNTLAFQPDIVENKVLSFVSNLGQAVATVMLVMFIALGFRTGFIVASLIPTAIAITLIMLPRFGYGLNQMTLAGLIIALGMLVDNAIVMAESIMVAMESGKSRMEACLESAAALKVPLLISSLTTMAAFLPILLIEENMGEYVGPMSAVVIITLFASWIVAMTLVPMLSYKFLKVEVTEENFNTKAYTLYRKGLIKVLQNKVIGIVGVFGMLVVGIILFGFTGKQFMADSDKPIMFTEIRLPIGTSVETTEELVKDLNGYIKKFQVSDELIPTGMVDKILTGGTTKMYHEDGIVSWGSFIGGGAPKYTLVYSPDAVAPEYAYIKYNVTDYRIVPELAAKIDRYLADRYPDVESISNILSTGSGAVKNVGYNIQGRNIAEVKARVEEVKQYLAEEVPGIEKIADNWNQDIRRVVVDVDQDRVRQAGLTSEEVAEALNSILTGIEATSFRDMEAYPLNSTIPVILRTTPEFRDDITALETAEIYSAATGETVPLKQIADIGAEWGPGFVMTENRLFHIEITAITTGDTTPTEIDNIVKPWLDERSKEWGPDVNWTMGGENADADRNEAALGNKLPIAGILIIFLLIAQFNSIKKTIVILSAIPLGIIGVSVGLLVSGQMFGFMPTIGLISLAGIVINNAIVLLDSIEIQKEEFGRTDQASVVEACQRRMRPIILTTITTLCGLIPLWLFGGPMFGPLAVSLIFGLVFATILTLGVVPLFYAVLFKINFRDYEYVEAEKTESNKGRACPGELVEG